MGRKRKTRSAKVVDTPAKPRVSLSSFLSRNWIIGIILSLTFLTFANCLWNGFVYDDHTQILSNEFIQHLSNIPKAMVTEVWYWRIEQDKSPDKSSKVTTPYYRPVFTIYLMAGWKLFGRWAPGWHLANILMHMAVVYFVFLLCLKLTGDEVLSGIATVFFALHPLKVESVAWISGLSDLLLALFIMPSFLLYLKYRDTGDKRYLAGSAGLFLVAAFTKEPAVSLPLFIGAYELFVVDTGTEWKQKIRRAVMYGGAFLAIDAVYFAFRHYSMGFLLSSNKDTAYSLLRIVLTIPIVTLKYLGLLIFPWSLSIYHYTPLIDTPLDIRFILPAIAMAALLVGAWRLWRYDLARFAMLWFLIMLLPVFNFPAFNENFLIQERYLYIPSVGFCLLAAKALTKIPLERFLTMFTSRRTAQLATVAVIVCLMSAKSFAQDFVWDNDYDLYQHGVQVASDQPMTHYIMGFQNFKRQDWSGMVDELETYVKMDPNNMVAVANLASAHLLRFESTQDRSHVDRAIALCEDGLNSGEEMDDALMSTMWDTLGHAYTYNTPVKSYDRALVFFQRGLALTPNNPMITMHVGAAYLNMGNVDMAFHFLESAKGADLPEDYKMLAYAYARKGQFKEAVDNITKYMSLVPNDIDAAREKRDLDAWKSQLQAQSTAPS